MKRIILTSNNNNASSLYEQLYSEIKTQIVSGDMLPHEKCPSVRRMAEDTGVSVTTVLNAYSQLVAEGYLLGKPGSGYYVAPIPELQKTAPSAKQSAPALTGFFENKNPPMVDPEIFDFVKWKKCAAHVYTEYAEELLTSSDSQGELPLREQISEYLFHSRGVSATTDRIVIGAGTQQITSQLCRILKRMELRVVSVEDPGYLPVQSMFSDAGFTVPHIPVTEEGISISMLPVNLPSAVYVSPSNQFPTGAVMPVGKRYELLKWAAENKSFIIEDDYDSELRYFGKPLSALKSLDAEDRVIYLGSFSSTLFPAIKISYMVLPHTMAAIYNEIKSSYAQTCSKAEQLTLALFMKEGFYYTGIRKKRTLYTAKMQAVQSAFKKYADKTVTTLDTKSGISMNIRVNSEKTPQELQKTAASLGLNLVPIASITNQKTGNLSFYYNSIPLDEIDGLIAEMIRLWDI